MQSNSSFYRCGSFYTDSFSYPFLFNSTGCMTLEQGKSSFTSGVKSPFVELFINESGNGELKFWGNKFILQDHDFFIFLPGEDREYKALSKIWCRRWIAFDGPLAEAIVLSYRLPRFIRNRKPLPSRLLSILEENAASEDPAVMTTLAGIIIQILASVVGASRENPSKDILFRRCVEFIEYNYSNHDLCIDFLCDHFDIPRSSLTKLFRENMHRSPGLFIQDVRFKNAEALLSGTELSIREISRRCGYENTLAFSRMIRRVTGQTPGNFRHRLQKGNCNLIDPPL